MVHYLFCKQRIFLSNIFCIFTQQSDSFDVLFLHKRGISIYYSVNNLFFLDFMKQLSFKYRKFAVQWILLFRFSMLMLIVFSCTLVCVMTPVCIVSQGFEVVPIRSLWSPWNVNTVLEQKNKGHVRKHIWVAEKYKLELEYLLVILVYLKCGQRSI